MLPAISSKGAEKCQDAARNCTATLRVYLGKCNEKAGLARLLRVLAIDSCVALCKGAGRLFRLVTRQPSVKNALQGKRRILVLYRSTHWNSLAYTR